MASIGKMQQRISWIDWTTSSIIPASSRLLSRHDTVVINRLRVGHTRLTNSYLLKRENQPECQACQSFLTVKHILIDCTHLSAVRQRYFRFDTPKDLFEIVDSRNIIAFMKDINFCHHYIILILY